MLLVIHQIPTRILRFKLKYIYLLILIFVLILFFTRLQYYNENNAPKFIKPEIAINLTCQYFFDRNETTRKMAISNYSKNRITWKTPDDLPMNCSDIFSRHYFPKKPLSDAEANFPIAYTKNVYTDYFIMEQELASTYAPQNFYCFSIDSKATEIFRKQIHALSSCFSNVFYTEKEFPLDSKGHYSSYAQFECLKYLIKYDWKYVILLLSHDIILKTNAEIVQILTWLDGTNDVMMIPVNQGRINMNYSWTFEELKIFKNDSYNNQNEKSQKLQFAKGMAEASLSKAAVDYLFNTLNLEIALKQFNDEDYFGNDENFLPTLLATEPLNIPGSFFHRCIDEIGGSGFFTRKSNWSTLNAECQSGIWRNLICIYGVEDLMSLESTPEMFGNKMLPEKDFGAYICWSEKMFNRTHTAEPKPPTETLNANIYLDHPAVRFNQMKKIPHFDRSRFKCSLIPTNSSTFFMASQRHS